ncbi:hypothetical protein B0O99DRAFT_696436 [Bisporella sp. PMI_857]|nr:hypothetical protein B0O99DRAFT_696436 [Bisporella sp. PMI_857]
MRFPIGLSLFLVGLASAEWRRSLVEDQSPAAPGHITARVLSDNTTCAERWGEGSIICSSYGCFNPTLGEQCCGEGRHCAGSSNSCCGTFGPGATGTDGVPATNTLLTPATPPGSVPTSLTCSSSDSGEECCQRLSSSQHWCSGSYPNFLCYNPESQSCCSDGSRCLRDNCCEFVGATAITPNVTQTTAQASRSSLSTPNSITSAPIATQTEATKNTDPVETATSTSVASNAAVIRNVGGGIAVAALNAIGMALL